MRVCGCYSVLLGAATPLPLYHKTKKQSSLHFSGGWVDRKVFHGERKCLKTACRHSVCHVRRHQPHQGCLWLFPEVGSPVQLWTTFLIFGKSHCTATLIWHIDRLPTLKKTGSSTLAGTGCTGLQLIGSIVADSQALTWQTADHYRISRFYFLPAMHIICQKGFISKCMKMAYWLV